MRAALIRKVPSPVTAASSLVLGEAQMRLLSVKETAPPAGSTTYLASFSDCFVSPGSRRINASGRTNGRPELAAGTYSEPVAAPPSASSTRNGTTMGWSARSTVIRPPEMRVAIPSGA